MRRSANAALADSEGMGLRSLQRLTSELAGAERSLTAATRTLSGGICGHVICIIEQRTRQQPSAAACTGADMSQTHVELEAEGEVGRAVDLARVRNVARVVGRVVVLHGPLVDDVSPQSRCSKATRATAVHGPAESGAAHAVRTAGSKRASGVHKSKTYSVTGSAVGSSVWLREGASGTMQPWTTDAGVAQFHPCARRTRADAEIGMASVRLLAALSALTFTLALLEFTPLALTLELLLATYSQVVVAERLRVHSSLA
jgi:hypothetical protein